MKNTIKNKNGGFLQLIFIIVIGLLLMRYYGISVDEALAWVKSFGQSIIDFFRKA